MTIDRIESHAVGRNTINILLNTQNSKYFVMDFLGKNQPSEYYYTLPQCYQYIKDTYNYEVQNEA